MTDPIQGPLVGKGLENCWLLGTHIIPDADANDKLQVSFDLQNIQHSYRSILERVESSRTSNLGP